MIILKHKNNNKKTKIATSYFSKPISTLLFSQLESSLGFVYLSEWVCVLFYLNCKKQNTIHSFLFLNCFKIHYNNKNKKSETRNKKGRITSFLFLFSYLNSSDDFVFLPLYLSLSLSFFILIPCTPILLSYLYSLLSPLAIGYPFVCCCCCSFYPNWSF